MRKHPKLGKTDFSNTSFRIPVDFIGIGAAKAATSWLARCLAEHPDICIPPEKELHFFSTGRYYKKGISYYTKFFNACRNEQVHGEFSTTYLSSAQAPERIHEHMPNVKLIVALRDPRERALSHIRHLISQKKLPEGVSVEEAVRAFPAVLKEGEYANLLQRWFQFFSKEQFLIVFVDDIEKNPRREIERTYALLGVRTDFIPQSLNVKYNTSRIRSFRFFKPINKLYRKTRKRAWGRFIFNILRRLNLFLLINKIAASTTLQDRNKDITREDRKILTQHYKRDIEELEKLLGRDLSRWKVAS